MYSTYARQYEHIEYMYIPNVYRQLMKKKNKEGLHRNNFKLECS